jgi:2'-5' RNA ligase
LEQIRAFIAVEFSTSIRVFLGGVTKNPSGDDSLRGHWVRPESIHITLKFHGNIAPICQAMSRCPMSVAPFELSLGDLY